MTQTRILFLLFAFTIVGSLTRAASAHFRPETGRWLERDPMESAEGQNRYEYVRTQPSRLADPSGLVGFRPGMFPPRHPRCQFKIKCFKIPGVPGSHCYIDFGDGDICSAHNPPEWPKPGPITPYCGPWRESPDRFIPNPGDGGPLGPERTTPICCPPGTNPAKLKKCVQDILGQIGECRIPYDFLGPNSNTSIWAAFQRCMARAGCKLMSDEGDPADPRPRTPKGAPPVGWPPIGEHRLRPINDCLDRCEKPNDQ